MLILTVDGVKGAGKSHGLRFAKTRLEEAGYSVFIYAPRYDSPIGRLRHIDMFGEYDDPEDKKPAQKQPLEPYKTEWEKNKDQINAKGSLYTSSYKWKAFQKKEIGISGMVVLQDRSLITTHACLVKDYNRNSRVAQDIRRKNEAWKLGVSSIRDHYLVQLVYGEVYTEAALSLNGYSSNIINESTLSYVRYGTNLPPREWAAYLIAVSAIRSSMIRKMELDIKKTQKTSVQPPARSLHRGKNVWKPLDGDSLDKAQAGDYIEIDIGYNGIPEMEVAEIISIAPKKTLFGNEVSWSVECRYGSKVENHSF